MIPML